MATSKRVADTNSEQQPVTPAPIYGDILDTVLVRLPLIHLVPASFVSESWSSAAYSSSLRTSTKPKPWLFVYTQGSRSPYRTNAHAYDPVTNIWITIKQPEFNYISALRSTNSNFIYMISASRFCFSFDPLHLTWHNVTAPVVSRIDPILSLVGHHVVVAGGMCDFEDDPLAVEIYDIRTCKWTACEPMPASLRNSASSTWLSAAVYGSKLYLTEKQSSEGVTYVLDLERRIWLGPYNLLPDKIVLNSVTGFVNDRLILIGLIVNSDGGNSVKVWKVNSETIEREIVGEMPAELVEKLKGEDFQISSIEVRLAGNFAYIYKSLGGHEVVTCEFVDGGCRWDSVRNKVRSEGNFMDLFVLACTEVGMKDLQKAIGSGNVSFKGQIDGVSGDWVNIAILLLLPVSMTVPVFLIPTL